MRQLLVLWTVFAPFALIAQLDSAKVELDAWKNSELDEMVCCFLEGENFLMARSVPPAEYLSDKRGRVEPQYELVLVERFAEAGRHIRMEGLFDLHSKLDDGTAYYHAADSTLWFSSAHAFAGERSKKLRIFHSKRTSNGWEAPQAFMHNDKRYDQCHPWLDAKGEHLFFSTDRAGGAGGMDLWYCVKFADGWSQPIWAGGAINTPGHELFPTLHGNRLFFSSDGQPGAAGLDVFTADGDRHWQAVKPLPSPINSAQDDLHLVFTTDSSGYLASNRGVDSGDDIYQFTFLPKVRLDHGYTAVLQCKGTPLQNERVELYLKDGTLVGTEVTGESGLLDISALHIGTPYIAKANDLDPIVLSHSLLYIKNRDGVIVQIIPLADEAFQFELLPYDGMDLPLIENPDNSILAVDLGGQIYREVPGDVGRGHPVYITSKDGELLSLAYTQAAGHFSVDDLRPLSEYSIQVDPASKAQNIRIVEGEEEIILPLIDGKGDFRRLRETEVIDLMDEFNQPIQVAADDVFILKNIYYSFDKAALNPVAKAQLNDLVAILKNNPNMGIELSSHTDSRGTDAYNYELSERRARTAVAYLAALGISEARLVAKGYGESRILNGCVDDAECSELEHALNRRTELRMFFD